MFTEPGSGWANMTQTAKLTASDGAADDHFGYVGFDQRQHGGGRSANATIGGNSQQGAAYVFTEPGSGWANMTQTAKLTASDGAADDQFRRLGFDQRQHGGGRSAGRHGRRQQLAGAAYVFTEPGSGWANMTQTAKLTASDGAADDDFGDSVSISGNTVVVGACATVGGNAIRGRPTCLRRRRRRSPPCRRRRPPTRAYTVGETVPITVTFNEPVNVSGTPQLTLNDGGVANYASGSGTSTLTLQLHRRGGAEHGGPGLCLDRCADAQWREHPGLGGQCGRVDAAGHRHGWPGGQTSTTCRPTSSTM